MRTLLDLGTCDRLTCVRVNDTRSGYLADKRTPVDLVLLRYERDLRPGKREGGKMRLDNLGRARS